MSITGSEQWMYRATDPFYPHTIDGALFIDGLSTASLSRAAVAVDDTTKATWSFWWKRASGLYTNFSSEGEFFLQNTNGTNRGFRLRTNSLGEGTLSLYVNPTSGTSAQLVTDREFRDQAGWVHVIWHWDSANAVESERVRLYVNGTRVTEFSTETYPPLNDAHDFNTGFGSWRVGSTSSYQGTSAGKRAFRGYLTEFHFMDGYNYGPEYFGETKSGVWVPIEVTGVTYGTGGWYLPMTSNGNDASGNDNHFTENSVGAHDYKTDSPTNNFCVLDANNSYNFRLSEGNLKFANTTTRWDGALATFAVPKTGKWYWEVYINAGTNVVTGLANGSSNIINDTGYDEYENYSYGINQTSVRYGTTVISTESPPTSSSGDILGWYVDDGDVYLYKNGTQIASPTSWTSNMDAVDYDYFPQIFAYGSGTGATFNFGQDGTFAGATTAGGNADSEGIGDFKYTVPTGAKALCTSNLPAPALADPSNGEEGRDYFETFIYTGNGAGLQVGDVIKEPAVTGIIDKSLIFDDGSSHYLSATAGSADTTFTVSMWFKRSDIPTQYMYLFSSANAGIALNNSTGKLYVYNGSGTAGPFDRDIKDDFWHHVVYSQSSGSFTLYLDGIQIGTGTGFTINTTANHINIGRYEHSSTYYFDGYIADVNFVSGTALNATSFGAFDANGVWSPVEPSVTYGSSGYRLQFEDATSTTTLGNDTSGNNNDFTLNNMATTDQVSDSPTNNFSTLSLSSRDRDSDVVLSEGNLNASISAAGLGSCRATIPVSSGKWYWEATITGTGQREVIGISKPDVAITTLPGYHADMYVYFATAQKINDSTLSSYGASFTNGDVIGVALDMDAGTLKFYKNGADQGTAFTDLSGQFSPLIGSASTASAVGYSMNFGQKTFAYTPPTGHVAISENNITVEDQNLESPDFVWIKNRDQADKHHLYDSVRGVQKAIYSNANTAETDEPNGLLDFNKNGFTIGNEVEVNTSGEDYVAWCWKAGTSFSYSGETGTIDSVGSVNTDSGFSIVTYTGSSVANEERVKHGLSSAPEMIMVKNLSGADSWAVYHKDLSTNNFLELNFNYAQASGSNPRFLSADYGTSTPTSTYFYVRNYSGSTTNDNGDNYVAYCFHSVDGFSKFGSFEGNEEAGQSDGAFVYTGFAPAFVMIKNFDSAASWIILDNKRPNTSGSAFNPKDTSSGLHPDLTNAESTDTTYRGDFLSNGFSVASGSTAWNNGNNTFVFMAFGETPFKYANAR